MSIPLHSILYVTCRLGLSPLVDAGVNQTNLDVFLIEGHCGAFMSGHRPLRVPRSL